jgi:hypothetical protein
MAIRWRSVKRPLARKLRCALLDPFNLNSRETHYEERPVTQDGV